jgi:hypothetical protein
MPTILSPNVAPDIAHHDGDEVLRCPGAKWHHAPAVLVVYAPCDYWLFSRVKKHVQVKQFQSEDNINTAVTASLRRPSKDKNSCN